MLPGGKNVLLSVGIIGLAFINPPRLMVPGAISKVMTVQTRDAAGQAAKLEETADLKLTSTSPTGEFVNDKGSKLSLVMSRGSANRNFYYRDPTVGSYLITALVTGRESGQVWQATQGITVGVAPAAVRTLGVGASLTPSVRAPAAIQPPPAPSLINPPASPSEAWRAGEGASRAQRGTGVVVIKRPPGFWSWLVNLLF